MLLNDQVMESTNRPLSYRDFIPFNFVTVYGSSRLPPVFISNVPHGVELHDIVDRSDLTEFFSRVGKGNSMSGLFFRTLDFRGNDPYLRYTVVYRKSHSDSLVITQNFINNVVLNYYASHANLTAKYELGIDIHPFPEITDTGNPILSLFFHSP